MVAKMELARIKNAETQRWPAAEKRRSQQGVWRNSKRWLAKIGGVKNLIDRLAGVTRDVKH